MSKIKNKLTRRLWLYSFLALFWLFYPGETLFLAQANTNSQAFIKTKTLEFKPESLPQLLTSFDSQTVMAESFLVMDLSSLTPIITRNSQQIMYPASLVKLATALVSFEHYSLEQILKVNRVINEELKMGLVKGEKISTINLLYGILVYSANDAAYTLAENYPGGVKEFVNAMNQLAIRLKMKNTVFTNPIGFDHPNQITTAYDLAILSREFIKNPILLNIASTKAITVSDADYEHFHYLNSINQLLGEIPHLGGLKTGTTDNAGQNLISFYRLNQKPLLIVVLKSQDRFIDTRNIIDFLNQNLVYKKII